MIPPILVWLATLLIRVFTGAQHVTVLVGVSRETQEWYGHVCYWRPWEIEIDGRWYEAEPRRCL